MDILSKIKALFTSSLFLYGILQSNYIYAQQKTEIIKGIVQNNNRQPLPGVSVVLNNSKNTFTIGTSTNNAGEFVLTNIPPAASYNLTFSTVGYEPQTLSGYNIKEGSSLNLSIIMVESVGSLDRVVVIGYGTVKKKDLTGAVSSVKSEEIQDLAVARIDQALLGKVAGVQVKPVSGEPGSSPQIRIRGIGSISAGASPLYVIDGFPTGNLQFINPNDIESIDILKDASATAIYGSQGSNGVVIINTKRGKAGKTNISFNTYYGWQKVSKLPVMMNAREQAQYFYDGVRNSNLDLGFDVSGPATSWRKPVDAIVMDVLAGKNLVDENAFDKVLVTAPQNQYQLSASGGNENIKYSLSGEYLNQDGIVLNSHFTRYSVRANIDAKLSKRFSIKLNLNPSFTDKTALPVTGNQGEGIMGSAISVINFFPLLDSAGNYTIFNGIGVVADMSNPLAVAREYIANDKGMRFLGNVEAEYKFTNTLAFRFLLGGSYYSSSAMTFKPQLPVFFNNPPSGTSNYEQRFNWLSEYTLNYNKSFNKHNITALAGFTAQKEKGYSNFLTSNKYPNNLVPTLSAVSGIITNGSSDAFEWSMISYLGRVNYNYNSKYYITASFRTDGSSRFGGENKYGIFPSAAIAWRISEEKFFKSIQFVNELKLRMSYGETGNNSIGNYDQYATINYLNYVLGGTVSGGFAQGRLANPSLTWETQKSLNAGVDVKLFKSRLSASVDVFQSRNYDLLLNVNIPSFTGYSTALQNIGEVKNTGWEFAINTVNFNGKFSWTTDFNISGYKNKVVRLGPEGDPIISGDNKTMIGKPIGMFYGLLTDGIFQNQAELNNGPVFNPGAADRSRVGDIRFKDISGPNGIPDGIINSFDNTIIGSPYSDFNYGMTNHFSYQNVGLSISFQGSYGSEVYNSSFFSGNSTRGRVRVYAFNNNYWKSELEPGDGKTPRPNDAPTGGVRLPSQAYLNNGSYLRINNITLDYVLPANIAQKLFLTRARVYLSATNPFLFTKYTKYNPDVSFSSNTLRPGLESNDYPLPKSIVIGLNLSF